ncbi:ribonuclease H-like protein [Hypoxylon sp. NC0597]|nr:ribonuclease H-like protein [Hypoxylon sp. NC0597]
MYTHGACSNNSSTNHAQRGGYAFVWNESELGSHSAPLEKKGADGKVHPHTSNRAQLRAVIAALKFHVWWAEGWERIIITTDSEYVSKGATEGLRDWAGRDWHTSDGEQVANQDLWRVLSDILGSYAESGCEISFWIVPRKFNALAARLAATAAERTDGKIDYKNSFGELA